MVTLPNGFVKTMYPGYFWDTMFKKLYSIKSTGELKAMKFHTGGTFNGHQVVPGYKVSHLGIRRTLTLNYLNNLHFTKSEQIIGFYKK